MAQRLADRCRQSFSVEHWQTGSHYHFVLDAAKIAASDEFGLQATVKAGTSRPDRVSLDWSLAAEDALLLVSCSCSSYRQGELCGHIVATILEADRRYLGVRVPGRGTLDVIDEAECEWELDDEIQEDIGPAVDRWEHRREVKPAPKRSRGAGASKTTYRASAPPNWQSRLQRLTRQVEVAAERFVAPQASVKGREIWYRLNASETAGRECLVIDFQQRERKLDGEFGKRKPLKLSPGEIVSLPDALDRELLSWMIGNRAEDQYSRPYCGSQSYYGYRHGSSSQICRCELGAGRLRGNPASPVPERPPRLVSRRPIGGGRRAGSARMGRGAALAFQAAIRPGRRKRRLATDRRLAPARRDRCARRRAFCRRWRRTLPANGGAAGRRCSGAVDRGHAGGWRN